MQRAVWTPDGLVVEECEPGPLADGWARLVVRRETYADLLRCEVE